MQIATLSSIITSMGVLGTLTLGFMNLYSLRKSENKSRLYNLNLADYEKRRDFLLSNLAEYLQLLDAHELTYKAETDEEYQGQDLEKYKKLYELETQYYKIKLMINEDNHCYKRLTETLDRSILLARKIRSENSISELYLNGLRTPERALEISKKALEHKNRSANIGLDQIGFDLDDKEKLNFIADAVENRNVHLKSLLQAIEELSTQKEALVIAAQKYLYEEKSLCGR